MKKKGKDKNIKNIPEIHVQTNISKLGSSVIQDHRHHSRDQVTEKHACALERKWMCRILNYGYSKFLPCLSRCHWSRMATSCSCTVSIPQTLQAQIIAASTTHPHAHGCLPMRASCINTTVTCTLEHK